MEFKVYKAQIDPSMTSDLEVNFIGLVDRPAIERNFQAFNEQKQKARFILNEEKRIISGPAMIADMPLFRSDKELGDYYVVFDKQSIQTIVQKFAAKGFMQNFNLFHDAQQQVSDVVMFNSFISDKELGVPPLTGFEDLADGSWFISAKVNNPAVWEKVKNGEIKGFSVEGLFSYIPVSTQKLSSNTLNDDDILFLQDMINHHQIGLQMAVLIDSNSNLYDFAQKIIKAESAEIEEMKKWLGNLPSGSYFKMTAESAVKRIEWLLNETSIDN